MSDLADKIRALPRMFNEHDEDWVSREVVLGLVEADVPEGAISLTVRGYEQVACVMEALRKAGYVSARGAAAERQMKRGSGT